MIRNQQELKRVTRPMVETVTSDAASKLENIVEEVGGVQNAARLLGVESSVITSILRGNYEDLTASLLIAILASNGEALALLPMQGMQMQPSCPHGGRMNIHECCRGNNSRLQEEDFRAASMNGFDDEPEMEMNEDEDRNWDAMTRSELLDEIQANNIVIPREQLLRMTRGELIEALERNNSMDYENEEEGSELDKDDILDIMAEALDKNPELTQCFAEMLKRTRR